MAGEHDAKDISDNRSVIRLMDEVQAGEYRTTAEQDAIFFSSFGAWQGLVDAERIKRDICAARGSNRPAVEL